MDDERSRIDVAETSLSELLRRGIRLERLLDMGCFGGTPKRDEDTKKSESSFFNELSHGRSCAIPTCPNPRPARAYAHT
jgi:hypothetical protein